MNTLQEIGASRRANRRFWNAEVKFRIALLRIELISPSGISGHKDRLVRSLKNDLQSRACFEYLD